MPRSQRIVSSNCKELMGHWSLNDTIMLINSIKKQFDERDHRSYNYEMNSIDWNKIKINGKTVTESKNRLMFIIKNIRNSTRNLHEMFNYVDFDKLLADNRRRTVVGHFLAKSKGEKMKPGQNFIKKKMADFKSLSEEERNLLKKEMKKADEERKNRSKSQNSTSSNAILIETSQQEHSSLNQETTKKKKKKSTKHKKTKSSSITLNSTKDTFDQGTSKLSINEYQPGDKDVFSATTKFSKKVYNTETESKKEKLAVRNNVDTKQHFMPNIKKEKESSDDDSINTTLAEVKTYTGTFNTEMEPKTLKKELQSSDDESIDNSAQKVEATKKKKAAKEIQPEQIEISSIENNDKEQSKKVKKRKKQSSGKGKNDLSSITLETHTPYEDKSSSFTKRSDTSDEIDINSNKISKRSKAEVRKSHISHHLEKTAASVGESFGIPNGCSTLTESAKPMKIKKSKRTTAKSIVNSESHPIRIFRVKEECGGNEFYGNVNSADFVPLTNGNDQMPLPSSNGNTKKSKKRKVLENSEMNREKKVKKKAKEPVKIPSI